MPLSLEEDSMHMRDMIVGNANGENEEAAQWNDEPPSSRSSRSFVGSEDASVLSKISSQQDPLVTRKEDQQDDMAENTEPEARTNKRFLLPALVGGSLVILLVVLLPIVLTRNKNGGASPAKPALELLKPAPLTPNELLGVDLPKYTLDALELDTESPQAKAFDWMQIDPKLETYSEEQRLQRFALATLFYSLNGHDWNTTATLKSITETRDDGSSVTVSTRTTSTESWLSFGKPECEWMTSTKTIIRIEDAAPAKAVDGGGRRLKFTEMQSLCGSETKTGSGSSLQNRAGRTVRRNMMMRNRMMMRRRMQRRMNRPMNGKGNNGKGRSRAYYYDDSLDSYDYYYYGKGKSKGGSSSYSGSSSSSDDYDYYYRNRDLSEEKDKEDNQVPWEPVRRLHLPENNLFGTLPPELALLTDVESIDLGSNALYGSLPTEIFASMRRLTSLTLQDNFLSGALPSHIGLWSNNLQNHKNNGLLPAIGGGKDDKKASQEMSLNFAQNNFNHTIPSSLAQLSSLGKLILADNNFTGPMVPSAFGALTNLHTLNLGANRLTGPLLVNPLKPMARLQELYLHQNQLTGELPEQMGFLTTLRILEMDYNGFYGTLPTQLHLLQKLERLLLYNNVLEGSIPTEFGAIGSLKILGLTSNELTSTIPSQLGLMSSLEHLWLYGNNLMGFIPTELGTLAFDGELEILAVHENPLFGIVPHPLCDLQFISFDCEEDVDERFLCGCNCTCMGEDEADPTLTESVTATATQTLPAQPPAESEVNTARTAMPSTYRFPDAESESEGGKQNKTRGDSEFGDANPVSSEDGGGYHL